MDKRELIERHLALVLEANETTNLTSIRSFDEGMLLHVEDSLFGLEEVEAAPAGTYGDLGSGGGFPGIPLAIMTERQCLLVDSVAKKSALCEQFIQELGLEGQIACYPGRIEDLAMEQPESFAVLTARALAPLGPLMELASPLLIQGGRLVCYKARVSDDELAHAKQLQKMLAMKLVSERTGYLSDGETFRSIYVFEKTGKPSIKLPRRVGMAQKKPL